MKKLGYRREVNNIVTNIISDTNSNISIDIERMISKFLQKKHRRSKGH